MAVRRDLSACVVGVRELYEVDESLVHADRFERLHHEFPRASVECFLHIEDWKLQLFVLVLCPGLD